MSQQQRPDKPLSQRSFEQWVGRLPLADAGSTAKALNLFFRQVGDQPDIKPAQRLDYLEALANPIDIVMHAFLRHFRDQAFPLPERVRQLNRSATDLLNGVLGQYRAVLQSETSWLDRTFGRARRATAGQRWLHYGQLLYYQHALLGLGVPAGFWRQAHAIYAAARQSGFAAMPVTELGETGETNLQQAYARLVLTALAPLQRLDPADLLELDLPLQAWSGLVEFTSRRKTKVKGPFCISVEEDLPPVSCDKQALRGASDDGEFLEIGADALARELVRLLKLNGNSQVRWPIGEKEVQLSRRALQTLYRYWCKPPTRRAPRSREHSVCLAAFGLGAVHRILQHETGAVEAAETADEAPPKMSIAASPATPQAIRRGEMVSHKESHGRDIWDSIYHDHAPMKKRHWSEVDLTQVYRPVTAVVEDSSRSGLCISTSSEDLNSVKVGDIVGLKTEGRWDAASVCWIAEEGERVRFGLRRVGTDCEPVDLDLKPTKGQTAHFSALLTTLHDGQRVVIAPRVTSLGSGHLVLENAAGRQLISGTPLLSSGRFVLLSSEPLRPANTAAAHPKL